MALDPMTGPERSPRFPSARASAPAEAVRALAKLLSERVGLRPAPENETGLRLALAARLAALGEGEAAAYVRRLQQGDAQELRALLPLVTVGKTEFFRDPAQHRALRGAILPELLAQARSERRALRLWSAGCATGEEPYSLAMLALELGASPEELELLATDVNPAAVAAAASGRFSAKRMRAVPEALAQRFWRADGEELLAGPALSACVRFQVHNLAADAFPSPERGLWDLVVCRNVIIYFDALTAGRVVRGFFERLREGGILCLGYSESLFRAGVGFELAEVDGAFLYRRPLECRPSPAAKGEAGGEAGERRSALPARALPTARPGAAPPLAELPPAELPPAREPLAAAAAEIEAGRFEEAVAGLRASLERAPGNLALLITLGNVLTVLRRGEEARAAYEAALAAEPLCREAHLFLGILCFEEGAARDEGAAREIGRALFLDPECALAHYYLGRLHERRADYPAARRAYRNAMEACRAPGARGPLLGYYPDLPEDPAVIGRAAGYALRSVEEIWGRKGDDGPGQN